MLCPIYRHPGALWCSAQSSGLKRIAEGIHEQGARCSFQIMGATLGNKRGPALVPDANFADQMWEPMTKADFKRFFEYHAICCEHLMEAGLDAVDKILSGEDKSAFCLVRPPGHHAERGHAMGFCVFNNIAIAGKWLQKEKGMKIAIVDFDVHHCNGTQEAFYSDPDSILVSLHRYPFYPGPSGSPENTGEGEGEGLNINLAMDTFVYPADYIFRLEEAIERVAEFKPGFLLVSAGFDAYSGDPLADFNLEVEDYTRLGALMAKTAAELCEGRLCCFLEGGYNLDMLPTLVENFLRPIAAGAE